MSPSANERRSYILDQIAHQKSVQVSQLSDYFRVSTVSIRRDLEELEKLGLLQRVHGGGVAIINGGIDHSYNAKIQRNIDEKERIGRAAAELICYGDHILFDASTTALQVAKNIPNKLLTNGNLTVITAALSIVDVLGPWKNIHLILLGGIYLPEYKSLVGPQTLENLKSLHADKVFLGTDGFNLSNGVTGANLFEAEVDRALAAAAREVIVVADSSKIGGSGLTTIIPIEKINKFITDKAAPDEFVSALKARNIQVLLV